MPSGLLIRLRPTGPWRIGPDSGVRDRVDRIYHSDSLYSAVCSAMARLGSLEAWLEATARAEAPAVRFASCFPYVGETLLVAPPRNLWPPPPTPKVRWKGARFVPVSVIAKLAAGESLTEEQWMIDGESECLLPFRSPATPGPFRVAVRSSAAVDRLGEGVAPHSAACIEFTPGSGLWTVAQFCDEAARNRWSDPLRAAFRLLADSGFGGERSRGWGRAEQPQITEGDLPGMLFEAAAEQPSSSTPEPLSGPTSEPPSAFWLLSLFHPAVSDAVDWQQGDYQVTTRGGRVESAAGWGAPKKLTRMLAEGSVIVAASEPRGAAADVSPDGFPHPVYRAGFALAIPVPWKPPTRPAG